MRVARILFFAFSNSFHESRHLPRRQRHLAGPARRRRRRASRRWRACFGNPSSSHATGLRARAILDDARARARRVLGAGPGRLLFTSGATEGIQTAVLSALCAVRERRAAGEACGDLLLYGATEHKAVPESLAHWNRLLGTGLTLCGAAGRRRRPPPPRRAARAGAARGHGLHDGGQQRDRRRSRDLDGIAARAARTRAARLLDGRLRAGAGQAAAGRWPTRASTTRRSPATSCTRRRASACCTCATARRSRR